MWYLGDFPSLAEKVATLALNLYTVGEGRISNPSDNFFSKIYWSENLGILKI